MLSAKRAIVIAGIAAIGMLGMAAPAFADGWGTTDCSQTPSPACQLGAGQSPAPGSGQSHTPSAGGHNPGHGTSGNAAGGNSGNGGDTIIGGGSNLASCSYVPSNYQPPAGGVTTTAYTRPSSPAQTTVRLAAYERLTTSSALLVQPAAAPATPQGSWYVWKCTTAGVTDGLYHPPVFIPNGQPAPGAAPLPSPAQLAQIARNQLGFPTPTIAANPAGEQLVNLPTWLWLSGGWTPLSATASVPGVSVTAVATPTSVTWSMGDGSAITCTGPGRPFPAGASPTAASPNCGHTYRISSASQAGQAFQVSATVHWTVTWSGAGQGGVFPDMTTTGAAAFQVAEAQALNTGG